VYSSRVDRKGEENSNRDEDWKERKNEKGNKGDTGERICDFYVKAEQTLPSTYLFNLIGLQALLVSMKTATPVWKKGNCELTQWTLNVNTCISSV
jgi:hypothetical protein